jgi:hypothetical protein
LIRRRALVVACTLAVVGAIAYAGWRSVFTGGWHDSGDRSYGCPDSPWHTLHHPLPPNAFGPELRGLPEACNGDAREVTYGWAMGMGLTVVVAGVVLAVGILMPPAADLPPRH